MNREARRWRFYAIAWSVGIGVAGMLGTEAVAGEHKDLVATNAAWQAECSSCHLAYPPRFLTAQSWQTIMKDLDRHFGVDASVDANAFANIGAFLEANAGRNGGKRIDSSALRITESQWFRQKHARIAVTVWNRADVRSPANCGACHLEADRGDFRERNVRLPR
ncbi:MAG: diheme cytochrome c [Betaproteobacteria bacterium]